MRAFMGNLMTGTNVKMMMETGVRDRGELAFGVASGMLGLIVLAILVFGPLGSSETASSSSTTGSNQTTVTVTHGRSSIWSNEEGDARAKFILLAVAIAYVDIMLGTIIHTQWRMRVGRLMRWVGVGFAFLVTLAGAMSIGLFLLPAATLGLIAALGGMGQHDDAQATR
jgi:hypothetical protein